MSPDRQAAPRRITAEQEPFLAVRALSTTYSGGSLMPAHVHASHQLLFASRGAMTVTSERSSWMIPPERAVLIPAGVTHAIRMWGDVAMRSLYVPAPQRPPGADVEGSRVFAGGECRVISVRPLLREVILRVAELAALDSRVPAESHLMQVLLDELEAAPIQPLLLPLPDDRRARAVAAEVLKNPGEEATAAVLARRCGVSTRTLERLFRAETGMRFGQWRQKARLLESVRVLVDGRSVTDAALDCGYASVSAYIAAFKQTFGCTPGAALTSAGRAVGNPGLAPPTRRAPRTR